MKFFDAKAICKAAVQELTAITLSDSKISSNLDSNLFVMGPVVIQPFRIESSYNSSNDAGIIGL